MSEPLLHLATPPPSAGSTKARFRVQSMNVTCQLRPPSRRRRGPGRSSVSTEGSIWPISVRPERTVNCGGAVKDAVSSMKCLRPKRFSASGPMNRRPSSESRKPCAVRWRTIGSAERSKGARPFHCSGHIRSPTRCSCRAMASSCWATRWRGSGGGVTGSTQPFPHNRSSAAAWRSVSFLVARNRQLRVLPGRRPVRPMRCRNEATLLGASIWMTRSRSPTSMPSSKVDVETMTQSRASAKACSDLVRSAADSDACERNTVTSRSRRAAPNCSTCRRESQNTSLFSPRCSAVMSLAAFSREPT